MKNSIVTFPCPANEPVKAYLNGSPERIALDAELKRQSETVLDIPIIIGGKEIRTGNTAEVVCPHDHKHVLARYHKAGEKEIKMAIDAAMAAHKQWANTDWTTRAATVCWARARTSIRQKSTPLVKLSTSSAIMCTMLRNSTAFSQKTGQATSTTQSIVRSKDLCLLSLHSTSHLSPATST